MPVKRTSPLWVSTRNQSWIASLRCRDLDRQTPEIVASSRPLNCIEQMKGIE